MAFRGHFDYALDAKNRLNVPPKFRAAFSEGVVLAHGFDPCAQLWPTAAFDRFTEQVIGDLNPLSPERRDLTRWVGAFSYDADLDSAGRVVFKSQLIEHAGIEREVVVVGVLDYLEVWSRERWLAGEEKLRSEIGQIVEGLGHAS